jgi:glycosyltransferase involved in cell wall biosynthesis
VIDNPVDLNRFRFRPDAREAIRRELGLRTDAPLAGIIGQITSWKGHDTAIQALALLPDAFATATLLIVGEVRFATPSTRLDNRGFRAELDVLVDELGLADRVVFLGQRDDIPDVISALDLLVVPSIEEPFGRTVAEAMTIGVPVIATTVGGPAELIEPGVTGLLASPGRPAEWGAAMTSVLTDRDAARTRVEVARERARERFDAELHARKMLAIFSDVGTRTSQSLLDATADADNQRAMSGLSVISPAVQNGSSTSGTPRFRVMYVNHTSVVAGAEQALLEHLRVLPLASGPITVLCPPGEFADELEREGRHVVPFRGTAISFRITARSLARGFADIASSAFVVRREAARERAELIHANSIRAGLIAGLARLLGGPPVIVHVHDVLPEGPVSRIVRRLLLRHSAGLVAVSNFTRLAFVDGIENTGVPFPVINNALDVEALLARSATRADARRQLDLPSDGPVLGMIGQITPWKGHHTAIRAMPDVLAAYPDAKLLIVGEARFVDRSTRYDNRAYGRELAATVSELGIADAVRFLGQRDDVPVVMRALDLLLLPSSVEPLGRVALEAMILGTPVLGTYIGGLPEVITDGQTGFLAPPGDTRVWTQRILRLLADRSRLAEVGASGRQALMDQLAHAAYVEVMTRLYEAAVADEHARLSRRGGPTNKA